MTTIPSAPSAVAAEPRADGALRRLGVRELRLGILCIVASALLFSTSHALIKLEGATYPLVQLMFFRGFFALIPLLPFFWREGLDVVRTRRPWLHALRSGAGIASMLAFFYALPLLPLADVTAINFTMPLFVTALSVPLLRERVGWRRWTAVIVGFSGVLLMVRPGSSLLDPAILLAVLSALGYAIAVLCMRALGSTERSATTTFYFTLACAVVGAVLTPFWWVQPTAWGWVALILVGVISGIAQLVMTAGYRYAPASIVAPFDYVAIIAATGWGFGLWGDIPTLGVVAGAAVVVGSGLFIFYREQHLLRTRSGA